MTTHYQNSPNVVVQLLKLPMVHSACTMLSGLYVDTKGKHPQVCEVVENGMKTITSMVSPVIIRLEPQISMANDLACIGLEWLANTFPVVHKPTEQITASAKNMMHEAKYLVSIAGNGTVDCVQNGISWAVGMMQELQVPVPDRKSAAGRKSPVKRAITAAALELDSALSLSEALVERALPPTSADMEDDKEDKTVEGFETVRSSFSVRLLSLTTKLCRRTYHLVGSKIHTVKDNWLGILVDWKDPSRIPLKQQLQQLEVSGSESSTSSSSSIHKQRTESTSTWSLPQHLHQHAVGVLLLVTQMYNLITPLSAQILPVVVQVSMDSAFAHLIHISINGLLEPVTNSSPQHTNRLRKPQKVKIPHVFTNGSKATISELH